MASEKAELEVGGKTNQDILAVRKKAMRFVVPVLRLLAFGATISATLLMALNKQTNTFVVATVGTTPIKATFTAKFSHTPAFVFFVIANGMASFHSVLMLAVELSGHKYDLKGLRFAIIPILDTLTVGLVSGAATAAAYMGELGRNGNSHARWNKTCDRFKTYCDRGSTAMLLSFISVLLFVIITAISIFKLRIRNSVTLEQSPSESFTNVSAQKCWQMVVDRLNQEFARRQSLGKACPPFEYPQSINGLAMFGFLSPHIIQAIEALDPSHRCLEYWNNKLPPKEKHIGNIHQMPVSLGNSKEAEKFKYPFESNFSGGGETMVTNTGVRLGGQGQENIILPADTHSLNKECIAILQGLAKKANCEELKIMQRVFCLESHSPEWKAALKILNNEIERTSD